MADMNMKDDVVEIRGLQEGEESAWLDMLAESFSAKGVPRAFFEGHMVNDPWFDRKGVRIAVIPGANPTIVSGVRVYRRVVQINGRRIPVGAIGDVGTVPSHRKKGLASKLLADAMTYMKDVGCQLSVLHTSKRDLTTYYSLRGYSPISVKRACYTIDANKFKNFLSHIDQNCVQRLSLAPLEMDEEDFAQLNRLHKQGISNLAGCFERNNAYWRQWIGSQCMGNSPSIWVLRNPTTQLIVAYGAFQLGRGSVYNGIVQCIEYFSSVELSNDEQRSAFIGLTKAFVGRLESSSWDRLMVSPMLVSPQWLTDLVQPSNKSCPHPAADNSSMLIQRGGGPLESTLFEDQGQMYHVLDTTLFSNEAALSMVMQDSHTFFNLDAF